MKHYTEHYVVTDGRMSAPAAIAAASPPAAKSPPEVVSAPTAKSAPAAAVSAPAAADPRAPDSTCLPSSGNLGPMAKAGKVSAGAITRSLVKRMHGLTGGNLAETARLTGLDRRTVAKWLKPSE